MCYVRQIKDGIRSMRETEFVHDLYGPQKQILDTCLSTEAHIQIC